MAIRVLTSDRGLRRNIPTVAISLKLRRLTMNKDAYSLLTSQFGSEPEYLQILVDDDMKGIFWIRPCEKEVPGSKKLDSPSPGTRSLHISMLLKEFKWSTKDTARFEIVWDESVQAARIDTNKRLDTPKE
jgi:hypothetical protein